jgi:hypothetical protein
MKKVDWIELAFSLSVHLYFLQFCRLVLFYVALRCFTLHYILFSTLLALIADLY